MKNLPLTYLVVKGFLMAMIKNKERMSALITSIQHRTRNPSNASKQEKWKKGEILERKNINLSLSTGDTIGNTDNMEFTKKSTRTSKCI